jgi:hypothetical protein
MDEAEAKKGTGSLGAAGFLSTLTHEDTRIEQGGARARSSMTRARSTPSITR